MIDARHLDDVIEKCIIFLIIFTPLAFGSVGLGTQIVLISVSEVIFFLWLANAAKAGRLDFKGNIFIYLFAAFLALIIFQLVPLPKFLLKILSPTTYKNYVEFLPGYKGHFMWRSISVSALAAQIELFKILSYGLVSFVVVNSFTKREQISRLLTVISITGFVIACFGIIQKFTWNGMIYWTQPVPEGAGSFGPFVNKNHFAGYMELSIPITAASVFISERLEKRCFFGFMAVVMLLTLFLCLSRAGIISFFVATVLILSVVFLRKHLKKYVFYILPAISVISISLFFITKAPLVERFSSAQEGFLGRLQIYKDAFRMFLDFPLFGAGLGNFGNIFSMYKSTGGDMVFKNAHSDWVQFLTEIGLVGFSCIAVFMWLFFKDILYCHFLGRGPCVILSPTESGAKPACPANSVAGRQSPGLRHDRFVLIIISAGLVSITSIILHGVVDVNLHIPSNILLACIIGAVLMVAAHAKFEDADR